MGKKKNQRKNSVKVPSYKNTEEMLLSSELADICGLEAGHTASVDQSIKLLWLYIKVLERRYGHHEHNLDNFVHTSLKTSDAIFNVA